MNLFKYEVAYRENGNGKVKTRIIEAVDVFEATAIFCKQQPNDYYISTRFIGE